MGVAIFLACSFLFGADGGRLDGQAAQGKVVSQADGNSSQAPKQPGPVIGKGKPEVDPVKAGKIPISLIVDDGAPLAFKIPNSFYREFGEWARKNGVKGKWSVIPCLSGNCIDGSGGDFYGLGYNPGVPEWITIMKTLYAGNWTFTPEIVTHGGRWDIENHKELPSHPQGEHQWLKDQSLEVQTQYIAYAMRMLKKVGLNPGGLTMCWSYPKEKNNILGEATLRAAEQELGLKFVIIFNDEGDRPGIIYRRDDGAVAVSMRPAVRDYISGGGGHKKVIGEEADKYITEDGTGGKLVNKIREGDCVVFFTHVHSLYNGGKPDGFRVLKLVVDRLNRHYGDKLQWTTGEEICRHFARLEKTPRTLNRLIAEKARPRCDVFWSGDPIRAAVLKAKGVSAPYTSPQAADLPQQYSDPEGHWTGFSCRARVIIYNRDLVPQGQEPKSVLDLADERFKDKACLANPLFGTTSMHAAALFAKLGDDEAREFFEGFAANRGKILSSNGEVRRRVAAGEFAIGLTDTDDFNVARQEGKPVGVVYPDGEGMGTVIVPNCAVLIAGGPNSANGQRFIDYLLTPAVEQSLAECEAAQMPVRSGVPVPAHVVTLDKLQPLELDYSQLGARLDELTSGFLKAWVDANLR
jgi:iron(III) transport system substrate-binding protein